MKILGIPNDAGVRHSILCLIVAGTSLLGLAGSIWSLMHRTVSVGHMPPTKGSLVTRLLY